MLLIAKQSVIIRSIYIFVFSSLSKPVTSKTTTTQSVVSTTVSSLPSTIKTNSAKSCLASTTGATASNAAASTQNQTSSSYLLSEQKGVTKPISTSISTKSINSESDSTSLKTKENNLPRTSLTSINFRARKENNFERFSTSKLSSSSGLTKNKLSQSAHNIFNKDDRKEDSKDICKNLKEFHRKTNHLNFFNKATKTTSRISNNNKANYYNNSNITINNSNKYNNNTLGHHNLINFRRKHSDNLHRSTPAFKIPTASSTENIFSTPSKSFGTRSSFGKQVTLLDSYHYKSKIYFPPPKRQSYLLNYKTFVTTLI